MKILLVEDSKFLRKATGRALTRAGYEMTFAADGAEALLIAKDKRPDLILLDMMLPKMSGLKVLRELKKEPATEAIPVVVLTGLSKQIRSDCDPTPTRRRYLGYQHAWRIRRRGT